MSDSGSMNLDLGVNLGVTLDGAGLQELSNTIKEISKGKDLQRYWKDVESATDSAAKAIERYNKNVNSKGLAENLLKQINALKALTKKENLSELFPNMELNLDELVESAKKIVPQINSQFSVDSFSQAFKTFDLLKEKSIDLTEAFRKLADYADLVSRNSELSRENSQFRELIGDSDVEEVKSKLSEIKRLRDQAEEIFTSFLKVNNVERTDYWGDEKFSDYFDAIRKGSLTATEAISRFKTEYAYLLEEGFKSNNDTFGLEQLQAFSNKLDSIFRQVEETSTKINDIISNGVITKSVENLSMDSSLSDSQRSLFGNLLKDEESLKSITALFQKLIEESNKTSKVDLFNDEQLQQVLSIFDKIEGHLSSLRSIISDVGDGGEFSPLLSTIDKINTSIKELSTSVKGIGLNMNIDVGSDDELDRKLQTKVANALQAYQKLFNNIKMSSAGGSFINQEFFDFNLDNYDTAYQKLKAIVNFIKKQRAEAKKQFNGYDALYEDSDKSLWKSAQAYLAQVTKAETEIKKANSGESNPLENLFGNTKDLSEVIEQLNKVVEKLNEISSSATEFKNIFKEGFNVTASVEEIDKLTNRVKELEDELSKIKLNHVNVDKSNISSDNNDLQNTIEALKQLSKLPGGDTLSLGKIMAHIAEGAKLANPEVKKLLESLRLLDSEGKIIGTHISEGTLNSGVDLNDKFAIISRNDAIENVDKLIAKEKEAQQQGILLARTLASVDIGKLHYDIQELAQGSSVHQMKNSTLQQFIDETRVLCNATDEQILKLYSDAQKLSDLGFKLDLNPSNIRYDENSGFSFIDLELRKINEEAPQTVAIMHTLTQSLMGFMGQRNRLNWDDEENFYTKDNYTYLQNMLKTYERLQHIFSSKLSTPDFNQAFSDSLQLVKTRIADIEAHFENLGTPIKDVFQGGTTSAEKLEEEIKNIDSATENASESAKEYRKILSQVGEFDIDSKVSAMYKRNDGQLESWTWRAKKDDEGNVLYDQNGKIDYDEPTITVISKYEQLEKIIVKADNELRNLKKDLAEIKAYDPTASTTNIEAKISDQKEYIQLLEQTVKAISQSDEYLLDEQQIIEARNKAAREYALTTGAKQEKTDAKQSASDEKKRLANIEQVNRALNKQQITIDAIEKTYNKTTNPDLDREVSNQQDLAELAQKKLAIQTKINLLQGQERNSANEKEFLELEKLIAEYKELAKYKLKANNPSKQELGGQNLQTLIQVQISNYDKLITKAEKYGDATSDTVEKLKEQRDILSKIGSDGKYSATADQYYVSRDTYKVESAALSAFEAETRAAEQEAKALNQAWEEANKVNNALNETKNTLSSLPRMTELDIQFSSLGAKLSSLNGELTSGKISVADYKKEVKSLTAEYSKLVTIQQNRDVETYKQNTKAAEQEAKAIERMNNELKSYNNQVPKKPADGQRSDKFKGLVQNYKNAIDEAQKYLDNLGDSPVTEEVKKKWKELTDVIEQAKKEMDAVPNAGRGSDEDSRTKEIDKLTKYLEKNTRISKEAREQLEGYLALLKSGDPSVNVKEIHTAWTKVAVAEREAGREGKSFLDIFKNKIVYNYAAQLAGYFLSFMDIIRYTREGIDILKEFDDGLTKISYTMDITKSQLNDLGESILDTAKDIDSSIDNAMQVSQIYANMNTSAEEIKKLSEPTLILSNLTGFDASTVADDIQAVTQQFEIAAEESMHIADVYDQISRNISVDYSKILELILETI